MIFWRYLMLFSCAADGIVSSSPPRLIRKLEIVTHGLGKPTSSIFQNGDCQQFSDFEKVHRWSRAQLTLGDPDRCQTYWSQGSDRRQTFAADSSEMSWLLYSFAKAKYSAFDSTAVCAYLDRGSLAGQRLYQSPVFFWFQLKVCASCFIDAPNVRV